MKKNEKLLAAVFGIFLLSMTTLFAEPLKIEDILSSENISLLKKEKMIQKIYSDSEEKISLLPETVYKQMCLENAVEKKKNNFSFVSESLYYVKKSDLLENSESQDITADDFSKVLRSYSEMKGLTYYSKNDKKTKVLYKDAYTVNNSEDRTKIADQTDGNADGKTLYVFQDDNSFGKNVYEVKYHQNDSIVYAVFTNIDGIGWGPVTAIEPGKMKIHLMVIDCGDSLCLYLLSDADCMKVSMLKKRIENSLTSRIDAMKDWFVKQF